MTRARVLCRRAGGGGGVTAKAVFTVLEIGRAYRNLPRRGRVLSLARRVEDRQYLDGRVLRRGVRNRDS